MHHCALLPFYLYFANAEIRRGIVRDDDDDGDEDDEQQKLKKEEDNLRLGIVALNKTFLTKYPNFRAFALKGTFLTKYPKFRNCALYVAVWPKHLLIQDLCPKLTLFDLNTPDSGFQPKSATLTNTPKIQDVRPKWGIFDLSTENSEFSS